MKAAPSKLRIMALVFQVQVEFCSKVSYSTVLMMLLFPFQYEMRIKSFHSIAILLASKKLTLFCIFNIVFCRSEVENDGFHYQTYRKQLPVILQCRLTNSPLGKNSVELYRNVQNTNSPIEFYRIFPICECDNLNCRITQQPLRA